MSTVHNYKANGTASKQYSQTHTMLYGRETTFIFTGKETRYNSTGYNPIVTGKFVLGLLFVSLDVVLSPAFLLLFV